MHNHECACAIESIDTNGKRERQHIGGILGVRGVAVKERGIIPAAAQ